MRISDVRAIARSLPYEDPDWKVATGAISEARMVFVEIVSDTGVVGEGCTSSGAPFISGESVASIVNMIEAVFSKLIISRSPHDIEDIMGQLDKAAFMNYPAKAGIYLALHDLVGKILGISAQRFIGSSQKRPISVMRLIGLKEPKAITTDAAAFIDQRFKTLKIKSATN